MEIVRSNSFVLLAEENKEQESARKEENPKSLSRTRSSNALSIASLFSLYIYFPCLYFTVTYSVMLSIRSQEHHCVFLAHHGPVDHDPVLPLSPKLYGFVFVSNPILDSASFFCF